MNDSPNNTPDQKNQNTEVNAHSNPAPAVAPSPAPVAVSNQISFDDFKKVELKTGKILTVEKVLDADKLLRLTVDFGEVVPRQIVSGIATYFQDYSVLVGKKCVFVTNLAPRTIRGLESRGMILTLSTDGGAFSLLESGDAIPVGTSAK